MTDNKKMQSANAPKQDNPEAVQHPAVDIFEDASAITLKADLPGVSKENLKIEVDGETLTIEGVVDVKKADQATALYEDVTGTRYLRSFSLSKELAKDKITAEMKDGELSLVIPKQTSEQPRKIEISVSL